MMSGTIVAIETCGVGCFCGKHAGLLNMAGGALFFEDSMRLQQAAAGVDALVAGNAVPDDPEEGDQGEGQA